MEPVTASALFPARPWGSRRHVVLCCVAQPKPASRLPCARPAMIAEGAKAERRRRGEGGAGCWSMENELLEIGTNLVVDLVVGAGNRHRLLENAVDLLKLLGLGPIVKGARYIHLLGIVRPVVIPRTVSILKVLVASADTSDQAKVKDICESEGYPDNANPVRQHNAMQSIQTPVGCWLGSSRYRLRGESRRQWCSNPSSLSH